MNQTNNDISTTWRYRPNEAAEKEVDDETLEEKHPLLRDVTS